MRTCCLYLLGLGLGLAGCAASDRTADVLNECAPPECPIGDQSLAIEVTPSLENNRSLKPDSHLSDFDVASVSVDPATGLLAVQLKRPVIISGGVEIATGGRASILNGTVVATRPSRIAGRPDKFYQTQIDNVSGDFSLEVSETAPGELYQLRIVSNDASRYPPQVFRIDASVAPGTPRQVHFDLVLDDPLALTEVKGRVTNLVGSPIPGMQVQATNPETKAVLSTTATTDASGAYSVRLARKLPAVVELVASPSKLAPSGTPTLRLPLDVSNATAAQMIAADLAMPALPATRRITYRITGIGSSGADIPVANATCQFTSTVAVSGAGVIAVFEAAADSAVDGTVTVDLIPGDLKATRDYQVSVSPPATSDFQATTFSTTVGATDGFSAPVLLSRRAKVSGRVIDLDRSPVVNVSVAPGPATIAAALSASSLAQQVKLTPTTTDADGRFILRVDYGAYDVALLPLLLPSSMTADSSGATSLPRKWLEAITVNEDLPLGDIYLPSGTLVRVVVTDPNGQWVPTASVQLYSLSPLNSACQAGDRACLAPPRLAAEGTTGSDGSVGLLLPAQTEPLANAR